MSSICKFTSVSVFILCFIASIVLGNKLGEDGFNWMLFLYVNISSWLFCVVLYALGEIVNQLQISNSNMKEVYYLLNKKSSKEVVKENNKSYPAPPVSTIKNVSKSDWICSKCGTKNSYNTAFCKDCGQYK